MPAAFRVVSRNFATCISFPGGFTVFMRIIVWRLASVSRCDVAQSGSCAASGAVERVMRRSATWGRGRRMSVMG